MVNVTQTENEIKIIIETNRLINTRPDVVLMPTYIKFNNPPIFFERHLTNEIDDAASFCRIFKREARITLIKKEKGLWPNIFQKLSKDELFQKRLEIMDQVVANNKQRDEQKLELYERKRRTEIEREVQRETAMRNKLQEIQEKACHDVITVAPKDNQVKDETKGKCVTYPKFESSAPSKKMPSPQKPTPSVAVPVVAAIRSPGKINVKFTNFAYSTPKRESQEGKLRPFLIQDDVPEKTYEDAKDST